MLTQQVRGTAAYVQVELVGATGQVLRVQVLRTVGITETHAVHASGQLIAQKVRALIGMTEGQTVAATGDLVRQQVVSGAVGMAEVDHLHVIYVTWQPDRAVRVWWKNLPVSVNWEASLTGVVWEAVESLLVASQGAVIRVAGFRNPVCVEAI